MRAAEDECAASTSGSFREACDRIAAEVGLCQVSGIEEFRPLTGGVSSDIAMVRIEGRRYCVKRALPRLKVAATWTARPQRSAAEYRWLTMASGIIPRSVPALFGYASSLHGFVMEYIPPDAGYNWKTALLDDLPDRGEAQAVAIALVSVHSASARREFARAGFMNGKDFRALRLDPYLRHTAGQHPDLAGPIMAVYASLDTARVALIHGDLSPKNILVRGADPILLDAECATFGDPAFDVAFCMTHLLLKAIHISSRETALAVGRFWNTYRSGIDWESGRALERRLAALLPMLLLARVDGKSPVEYLSPRSQKVVREIARLLVAEAPTRLDDVIAAVLAVVA